MTIHSFNISQVNFLTSNTTVVRRSNQFDEHGSILSLKRLKEESNWEYKRRILDAATNRSNSSYRGLINGITRELGLSLFEAININPRVDGDNNFLAIDPYIVFDHSMLILYSDYYNGTVEWAIDRYKAGGNYEHIGRLVDLINTTDFFEASLISTNPYIRSMTILNQSNRRNVRFEYVPQSNKFKLQNTYLTRNSVFFSDRKVFKTEQNSINNVDSAGDYYINYTTGMIFVYSMPVPQTTVRYKYTQYPFKAIASPVILHEISNENFQSVMFEQIESNDTFYKGLPTELGVDIINELMSIIPMYWGI